MRMQVKRYDAYCVAHNLGSWPCIMVYFIIVFSYLNEELTYLLQTGEYVPEPDDWSSCYSQSWIQKQLEDQGSSASVAV